MTYSFTKPTSKHLLKPATKIWGFYFILAFGILIGFKVHVVMQVYELKQRQESIKQQQESILKVNEYLKEEEERKRYEQDVINKIKNRDDKLRQQIDNILRMIPDKVQINEIIFEDERLIMRGFTASRDLFETSLTSQLRAIYNTSEATFYQLPSGWLNFESVSKTIAGDGLINRIEQ